MSRFSFRIPAAQASSERAELVARAFGLSARPRTATVLDEAEVPDAGLVYVTGYSGSGKSTLLRLIRERRPEARVPPQLPSDRTRAVIDLFTGELGDAIRCLSSLGLGEAQVFTSPARVLSEGQRARLALALLMFEDPRVVVIDEFLSTLDRLTAKIVAYNFQKLCRRRGVTAYLASAHDDLAEALAPDHLLSLDFKGESTVQRFEEPRPRLPELDELRVEAGELSDYEALARFHYMGLDNELFDWGPRVRQIRRAVFRGRTVGVSVYVHPFPAALDELPLFRALNRLVLFHHRSIVHPALRGIGLVKRLEAEPDPEARAIVSVSALGVYYPYLCAMGYASTPHPRSVRRPEHEALERCLGASEPRELRRLQQIPLAQACYDALPAPRRAELRGLVRQIIARDNLEHCLMLAQIVGIEVDAEALATSLTPLFTAGVDAIPDADIGGVLSEALYFPMQAFHRQLPG